MNMQDPQGYREAMLTLSPALNMYYRDFGVRQDDALPVICLHGYWRTCRDFEELAVHLSARQRVVTPDLRGRGRSSRSTDVEDYHFDRLREDIVLLLRTLGIERAVFVGTALGAQIAMDLANESPDLVAGIAMNDSGPESEASAGRAMAQFSGSEALTYEQALDRIRTQYARDFPRFGEEDWARYVRRGYRRTEDGLYVRDFDQLTNVDLRRGKSERPDFWREYSAIRDIPIAILRGANSAYLTEEIVARMLKANRWATLYTIPNVGHPPALYEPESFRAVEDLLMKADPAVPRPDARLRTDSSGSRRP